MSGNVISKSLQTIIAAATDAVPGATDLFVFAPAGGTRLVTNAKKCTLAEIISGGFPNLTYDGTTLTVPTFQPSTSYKAVDGTVGETAAIDTGVTPTLTVKNGLITAHA